jgi:hypothetical protein
LTVDYRLAGGTGGNAFFITDGSGSVVGPTAATTGSGTANITVANNSGGGSGGNMPPFVVLNHIIKT